MTSDLTCPTCGGQLVPWAVGDVTVHGCQACGGVWFERDGIEAAASLPGEALRAIEHEFSAGLGTLEGDGCCPQDGTPLRTVRWYQAPQVSVRACQTCRGIWCDEGVLGDLESALPASRPRRELPWLEAEAPPRRIETTFCHHCGWPVVAEAMVCDRCGHHPHTEVSTGAITRRFGVKWWRRLIELPLAYLAVVVISDLTYYLPAVLRACCWLPPIALYATWWLFRPNAVECSGDGLTLVSPRRRRFVSWGSIRAWWLVRCCPAWLLAAALAPAWWIARPVFALRGSDSPSMPDIYDVTRNVLPVLAIVAALGAVWTVVVLSGVRSAFDGGKPEDVWAVAWTPRGPLILRPDIIGYHELLQMISERSGQSLLLAPAQPRRTVRYRL